MALRSLEATGLLTPDLEVGADYRLAGLRINDLEVGEQ